MAINSLNSASNGMAGLASGMDTQSMVDAMLSGTQAKIDKQNSNKAVLGYKQTMYRNVLSSLKTFREGFMKPGSASATNMRYAGFWNTMSVTNNSTAFKVTASSSAAAGKTVINSISQLARAAKIQTANGSKVAGTVEGVLDRTKMDGQDIQVELDGVRKTIKLPGADVASTLTDDDLRTYLQESINKAFGNGITVGGTGSQITFEAADNSREFGFYGNLEAMAGLGMDTGASNKVNLNMSLDKLNLDTPLVGDKFAFTINGEKFEFSGSDALSDVITKVNQSDANVRLRYSSLDDKFIMESTVSGSGVDIKMSQESGNLMTSLFGVASGNSLQSKVQYAYGDMSGRLGGLGGSYTPGDTMSDEDYQKVGDVVGSITDQINNITKNAEYVMKFKVEGEEVSITLPKRGETDPEYTLDTFVTAINDKIKDEPKMNGFSIELEKETDATGAETGRLTGGVKVNVPAGVEFEPGSLQSVFGLEESNKKVATGDSTLAQLGYKDDFSWDIKGADGSVLGTVNFTTGMKMSEMATAVKNKLTDLGAGANVDVTFNAEGSEGGFRIFGVDIPMSIDMGASGKELFGATEATFNQGNGSAYIKTAGQNAKIVINGIEVERNSNEFTIDGMSYELRATFNESNDATKVETIETTRDNDKIYSGITKFMDEYNKILDNVWGMLKEKPTYKDYAPLTDKQKTEMTDKEIELWETKSQEGLLRGDSVLEDIMNTLRRTLLEKPEGAKYSLADMGITVAYDIEKGYGGMLKFSDNTGDKLKQMIAQEPEEMEKLFSKSNEGLMYKLDEVVAGATQISMKGDSYKHLSLADIAGAKGMPDTASKIYNQMRDIDKNLDSLKVKYKAEYTRYWNQFNAMEKMIANMNSQSSWLTQQFQ